MAQCVELELEDCLEEIEKMQLKIEELEAQLYMQRLKDGQRTATNNDDDDDDDIIEDAPLGLDSGNLNGYEKVVAQRKNPSGTTTQMFALKKTIPPPLSQTSPRSATLPCGPPGGSPTVGPLSRSLPPGMLGDLSSPSYPSNNVIYMKHSQETAVFRPHQAPCPGAGPGCTCPSGPVHTDQECRDRPRPPSCPESASTCPRPGPCPPGPPPRSPCGLSATQPAGTCGVAATQPALAATQPAGACATSTQPAGACGAACGTCGHPCGARKLPPTCSSKPPCQSSRPCASCADKKAKTCSISGVVTPAERNENPFTILGTMVQCAAEIPPAEIPREDGDKKSEEEEKLEDVVNFINQDIFPILLQAVQGIIERVDASDACFCLTKAMESENAFNEAIRKYRNISKGINCFMQDILKSLSSKLAERSKKYSPQMELLMQGRGVVEQAEIALSEEIGRAIGREENDACTTGN